MRSDRPFLLFLRTYHLFDPFSFVLYLHRTEYKEMDGQVVVSPKVIHVVCNLTILLLRNVVEEHSFSC